MVTVDSSAVVNSFMKKEDVEPRQWGIIKDPKPQMSPGDLKKNEVVQKFNLLKQDLKTLRNSLKANDIGEFKKQIGGYKMKRSNLSNIQVESKVKVDILNHIQRVESKCNNS